MPNKYLQKMIRKYEVFTVLAVSAIVIVAFFCGRYININGYDSILVGIFLGVFGGLVTWLIESFMEKRKKFEKGNKLETQVAERLDKYNFEQNIETGYGDLDFFVETELENYGLEIKNYDGKVEYINGVFYINNFDYSLILSDLLRNCKIVRDKKFGDSSTKFIKPMLVFGYKMSVNIPNNVINFNRVDIVVTDIKNFTKYLR